MGRRKMGDIIQDFEDLAAEVAIEHELQMGDILSLVFNYMRVHYPQCVEIYEDGSNPEFYYGVRRCKNKN